MTNYITIEAERGYCSSEYQPFPDKQKFFLTHSLFADIKKARKCLKDTDYISGILVGTGGLSYELLDEDNEEIEIRVSFETITVTFSGCWVTLFEKHTGDTVEYELYGLLTSESKTV